MCTDVRTWTLGGLGKLSSVAAIDQGACSTLYAAQNLPAAERPAAGCVLDADLHLELRSKLVGLTGLILASPFPHVRVRCPRSTFSTCLCVSHDGFDVRAHEKLVNSKDIASLLINRSRRAASQQVHFQSYDNCHLLVAHRCWNLLRGSHSDLPRHPGMRSARLQSGAKCTPRQQNLGSFARAINDIRRRKIQAGRPPQPCPLLCIIARQRVASMPGFER